MVINIQDDILRLHAMGLLDRLLADKATRGNILWATDAYAQLGEWYSPGNEIRPLRITGDNSDLIKTRARRAMEQRSERTRQHAEVFTPIWIVKKMNDFADEQWFGRKDGIYKLTDEGKIYFSKDKHWKLYVDARRLEITCGEAPFLATRYDVETGEAIPVEERIGLLDRKLRAVSENAQDVEEWKHWALRAVQAIYGYELQGDNLLIARVNILCTVEEHLFHRWRQKAEKPWLEKLCNVIAWNLWQMDGIHGCVPVPPTPTDEQLSLFPPLEEKTNLFGEIEKLGIPCRLYDWRGDRSISYTTLREKGTKAMKFDFIIGNPPYQEDTQDTSDKPIYNFFMDEAYKVSDRVELISPARFLFDAGKTPKAWNRKMLEDPHLKVLWYEQNSSKVFSNTDIKGGVAVTFRDRTRSFGKIDIFVPNETLRAILYKVRKNTDDHVLADIVNATEYYKISNQLYEEHPEFLTATIMVKGKEVPLISKGHENDLTSNILDKNPAIFFEEMPRDGEKYAQVYGREQSRRVMRYIKASYLQNPPALYQHKIILPESNNNGTFGETIVDPFVAGEGVATTQTFITIGGFSTREEADNALKYIKGKFARAMLGTLKITQHNKRDVWKYVPLQDFTSASDIDWSKSIPEIDRQLYAKYGLDASEIEFIETHVKEMS